jgi:hypothetical protein
VWVGSQPSAARVRALDAGWSVAKIGPSGPNRSAGTDSTGSESRRPMTVTMPRTVSLSSATACQELPAGACSSTSRKQHRRVEGVDGRPALRAVAGVGRGTGATGVFGLQTGKSSPALVVDGAGQPDRGAAHTL